jgi:hypothetical protein
MDASYSLSFFYVVVNCRVYEEADENRYEQMIYGSDVNVFE